MPSPQNLINTWKKKQLHPKLSHFKILQEDFMNLILSVPVCVSIPMWRINKWSALQGLGERAAMFSFMMWYFPQKRDGSSLRPEMWARGRESAGRGQTSFICTPFHFRTQAKLNIPTPTECERQIQGALLPDDAYQTPFSPDLATYSWKERERVRQRERERLTWTRWVEIHAQTKTLECQAKK